MEKRNSYTIENPPMSQPYNITLLQKVKTNNSVHNEFHESVFQFHAHLITASDKRGKAVYDVGALIGRKAKTFILLFFYRVVLLYDSI